MGQSGILALGADHASASLEVHCQSLLAKAQAAGVLEPIRHLQKAEALINIAAFLTPMCTVMIPRVCLEAIGEYSLGLEVTCYPSDMERWRARP